MKESVFANVLQALIRQVEEHPTPEGFDALNMMLSHIQHSRIRAQQGRILLSCLKLLDNQLTTQAVRWPPCCICMP